LRHGSDPNNESEEWTMTRITMAIAAVALLASVAYAQQEAQMGEGVSLTVYNANFATVKERRFMDFKNGVNEVKFVGVASTIDATSVIFSSLTAPKAVSVLEQNYEFDLVNADKILDKYLDQKIGLTVMGSGSAGLQEVSGVLKSFVGGQLVLTDDNGNVNIVSRSSVQGLKLGALPDGLLTRPTLVWKVGSRQAARHLVKVAYLCNSISWKCDYIAVVNKKQDAMDFSGWVTINNQSGATYTDAKIKLIAGDVRRVQPQLVREYSRRAEASKAGAGFGGFEEKSFAEYHMYTLGRPSTVNMNQVKQIELIEPAMNVPVLKYYWYPGGTKVNVKLEVQNKKEAGLGIALPKGKVRVHQKDEADGSLEFIGEDEIDHTPRDEKFTLYIGDAFDIVGETKNIQPNENKPAYIRRTLQVELRNHKDEDIVVRVPGYLGQNWKLEKQKLDGKDFEFKEQTDAWTVVWYVPVPKNGKATLVYTVFNSRT